MRSDGREERAQAYREFFAKLVTGNAGLAERQDLKAACSLRAAFAAVERERFVGAGPWKILTRAGYVESPSDDPAFVYCDAAIALQPAAQINNGQPSLHALCLAALDIAAGETITHIGAGTGYYTAVLAQLTGREGDVHAYEIEAELAGRAQENLRGEAHVTVYQRSGTEGELPLSDVVYVSAGATSPQSVWLDALRPAGRLLFPLTGNKYIGGMLLLERGASEIFKAKFLTPAAFVGCAGARDERTAEGLTEAFARGDLSSVRSLRRNSAPDESCWFAGDGWWLSKAGV